MFADRMVGFLAGALKLKIRSSSTGRLRKKSESDFVAAARSLEGSLERGEDGEDDEDGKDGARTGLGVAARARRPLTRRPAWSKQVCPVAPSRLEDSRTGLASSQPPSRASQQQQQQQHQAVSWWLTPSRRGSSQFTESPGTLLAFRDISSRDVFIVTDPPPQKCARYQPESSRI